MGGICVCTGHRVPGLTLDTNVFICSLSSSISAQGAREQGPPLLRGRGRGRPAQRGPSANAPGADGPDNEGHACSRYSLNPLFLRDREAKRNPKVERTLRSQSLTGPVPRKRGADTVWEEEPDAPRVPARSGNCNGTY